MDPRLQRLVEKLSEHIQRARGTAGQGREIVVRRRLDDRTGQVVAADLLPPREILKLGD